MAERQKAPRGKNATLDNVRSNTDFLQNAFGDFFEAAERYNAEPEGVPLGEAFDAGITAALTRTRASQQLGSVHSRKEAAHQERQELRQREADSASRAAQGVLADAEDDEAPVTQARDEQLAQAKAMVGQWDEK